MQHFIGHAECILQGGFFIRELEQAVIWNGDEVWACFLFY